jgi:aspartyl-tRNA(Asn)/glutamyl-tRNA(Gln) amidotransferase subunit B
MSDLEKYMVKGYLPTIGIECHVQFKTKTKLFAAVSNDAKNAEPNTVISHICLGMPGALPVLNEKAIELAIKASFALGTRPQKFSKFDRKHYFYPDLPKGYQITQFEEPIILGGHVDIVLDNKPQRIGVTRAHLEEDAGKSTHPAGVDYSLVDLNRAGTPLLEIVSEPDMHNAAEAKAYVKELYLLMRYADVSDADLYHGNMRFDVNVSVSKDHTELGTRTETKNLNSFKSVEKTVEYEIKRQIEVIEKGGTIVQETRGWDDAKQKTFSQRTKEDAHDYRYFPEPDVPPVLLEDKVIDASEKTMPVMPGVLRQKLEKLGLDISAVETLVDEIIPGQFMLKVLENSDDQSAKRIANWLVGEIQAQVSEEKLTWEKAKLDTAAFEQLSKLTSDNQISSTGAKTVLTVMVQKGGDPLTIAKEHDALQVSDEGAIEGIVKGVIEANSKAAEDIKNGEMKAIGFLVGQVMKESKGKANPGLAQQLIKKQLGL